MTPRCEGCLGRYSQNPFVPDICFKVGSSVVVHCPLASFIHYALPDPHLSTTKSVEFCDRIRGIYYGYPADAIKLAYLICRVRVRKC